MDNSLSAVLASATLPDDVSRAIYKAEILVSPEDADAAIDRLAVALTALAQDQNPILLTLLPGAGYLSGALLRRTIFPLQTGYAYWHRGDGPSPQLTLAGDLPQVRGRLVVVVDDGRTSGEDLDELAKRLREAGATQGWRCSMVGRPATPSDADAFFTRSLSAVTADIEGVFGCGLDLSGYCRNLPGLYRT